MLHPIRALDRSPRPFGDLPDPVDDLLRTGDGARIRCPKCTWQPRRSDLWFCSKCNEGRWNTFETKGVCPVCRYHWTWTACLACTAWSPHEDWYEKRA
jgi:hypothetical protein